MVRDLSINKLNNKNDYNIILIIILLLFFNIINTFDMYINKS